MAAPLEVQDPDLDSSTKEETDTDRPWSVVVWNDPINLISYVSFVLRKLFGYSETKADRLTLTVHNNGRAIVASGTRSDAERDVHRLQSFGLWATMEHND